MLCLVTDVADPILDYIKDDPVRPQLSREFRVSGGKFVSVLVDRDPRAIVCVSLQDSVPESLDQLGSSVNDPSVAVFYTIWSYSKGAGSELLRGTVEEIRKRFPKVQQFVTLSPKTELARNFHLRNGAELLRENLDSVNFQYRNL